MDSVKVKVNSPLSFKGTGVLSRPYLVYPIEISTPTICGSASRRYTDFELLRCRLNAVYWYCIIPPLPEKESLLENLGIFDAPDYQERMGHTRREEFRQFLHHVYAHPTCGKEPVLRHFLNDEEWRGVASTPYPIPSFLDSSSISAIAHNLYKKATYQKDISKVTFSIEVQRQHMDSLRKHFQISICHRRDGSSALKGFGEDFQALGDNEGGQARSFYSAINGVCAKIVCSNGLEFIKEENLLAILNYWYNMYGAVLEAYRNVAAAEAHYRNVVQQIETLKNTPSKANTDISYVDNLRNLEKDRDTLQPILKDADALCRDQLKNFQKEMNLDLSMFLVRYTTLLHHSAEFLQMATTDRTT